MKPIYIVLVLIFSILVSCKKKKETGLPKCIEQDIAGFTLSSKCSDSNVKEYLFQNQTVYLFNPGSCITDGSTAVLSTECKTLGHLGGFSGNDTINGVSFSNNATFVQNIWNR